MCIEIVLEEFVGGVEINIMKIGKNRSCVEGIGLDT